MIEKEYLEREKSRLKKDIEKLQSKIIILLDKNANDFSVYLREKRHKEYKDAVKSFKEDLNYINNIVDNLIGLKISETSLRFIFIILTTLSALESHLKMIKIYVKESIESKISSWELTEMRIIEILSTIKSRLLLFTYQLIDLDPRFVEIKGNLMPDSLELNNISLSMRIDLQ